MIKHSVSVYEYSVLSNAMCKLVMRNKIWECEKQSPMKYKSILRQLGRCLKKPLIGMKNPAKSGNW